MATYRSPRSCSECTGARFSGSYAGDRAVENGADGEERNDCYVATLGASMTSELVVCASCGTPLPLGSADVVGFGTGYRCESCTVKAEVDEHVRQAAVNDRQRRESRYKLGYYAYGPSAEQVKAEVDSIRHHVATPDEQVVPTPAESEPVIQADEETLLETMTARPNAQSVAAPTAAPAQHTPKPRYLCIVCFKKWADASSECPRDNVPMADLRSAEAVDELRAHVRRAANRREGLRTAVTLSASVVAMVVICLAMGWDLGRRGPGGIILAVSFLVAQLVSRLVVRPIRVRNDVDDLLVAIGARPTH